MGLREVQHPMAGGAASPGTTCAFTLSPDSSLFPTAQANSDGPVKIAYKARGHDGLHAAVHGLHGLGHGVQAGIRVEEDGSKCHGSMSECRYFRHFWLSRQGPGAIFVAQSRA